MKDNKYSYNLLEAIEDLNKTPLKEAHRSVAEIEAEIARLKRELAAAKVAEKKAAMTEKPTVVWVWDMYLDPKNKGTWTSAELYNGVWDGIVFESKDKALNAAWDHLKELDDAGELGDWENPVDPDEYTIEAFSVPVSDVDPDTFHFSNLEHYL